MSTLHRIRGKLAGLPDGRAVVTAAVLVALLPAPRGVALADEAFLGVSMSVHDQTIELDGRTFDHGIRIDQVVADSAAQQSGLMVGDVIVAVEGVDFAVPSDQLIERFRSAIQERGVGGTLDLTVFRDGVEKRAEMADGDAGVPDEAWTAPEKVVEGKEPGTRLTLTVERVRRLLTLNVTLGSRPQSPLAPRPIPPNEEMGLHAEAMAEEAFAQAVIRAFGIDADYVDLRQRLAALVDTGDPYRLNCVAYVLREPFTIAPVARQIADVPAQPGDLIRHAARWLDQKDVGVDTPALRTGLSPEEHAAQLEEVLERAGARFERAIAGLTADERAFVEAHLAELGDSFIADVMLMRDTNAQRLQHVIRIVEIAAKLDLAELAGAATELSALLAPEYLAGLQKDLQGRGGGVFFKKDTPFGEIRFAGDGDDWHAAPAAVLIDLGGDDFYSASPPRPFSVIIDLAGDDLHQATFPHAQGSGFLGVSLLYDARGNDRYIGQRWAQGSAALGVGLLWDRAGDDVYRASDYSQATAFRGIGAIIDDAGNDRYDAPRYAQAFGMPGGFGLLLDRAGHDVYYCSGRDQTGYGTAGVFEAFGQGSGTGFRGLASGGLGFLVDQGGDDVYESGNFAQGGGYYFGWGSLIDRDGNDRYLGMRYAQAYAAHQALGYLEDHAGDDRYVARRDVGQSCSWDLTVTALVDHAGDDTYTGGGFGLAASAHNGLAILVDYAGKDSYLRHPGPPRAGPNDYHGGTSFSLLLDCGGADDRIVGGGRNGVIQHANEHGIAADLPGDEADGLRRLQELISK